MSKSTEQLIAQIQNGSTSLREELIGEYRPFIIRAVSHVCKRRISWTDDEASIGLIAFNEAIDRFNDSLGKTFDNFAFMVIRNRLIDEFRKQSNKQQMETVFAGRDDDEELSQSEIIGAWESYEKERQAADLAQELMQYDEMLQLYGIQLEELEDCSPSHADSRMQMIRIARKFGDVPGLWEDLQRTRRLPLKRMLSYAGVSLKTLERNRKYLIALILIFAHQDFEKIRGALSFIKEGE